MTLVERVRKGRRRGVVADKQAGNDAVTVYNRAPALPSVNQPGRGFYTGKGSYWVLGASDEYPKEYDSVDVETREAVDQGLPLDNSASVRTTPGNTRRLVDSNSISGRITAFFKGKRRGPKVIAPVQYQRQKDELIRRQISSRSVNVTTFGPRNGK